MESALYGIYARVVDVSEIERVSAANEWDFWYKNNECVNTVRPHFPWSILYIFPMKWEGFSDRLCTFFRNCGVVDPSWAELRHFVNFLNSQLQACEASAFCNMKLVGDTLKDFRSFVVQFMILMSRVRNMENGRSRRICGPVPRS